MEIKHVDGKFKVKDMSLNGMEDIKALINILGNGLEEKVKEAAVDELSSIFMDGRLDINFPQIFKDDCKLNDPTKLVITVEYSEDYNNNVLFELSLRDMLMESAGEKELTYGNSVLSAELRKLADDIDNAISAAK